MNVFLVCILAAGEFGIYIGKVVVRGKENLETDEILCLQIRH